MNRGAARQPIFLDDADRLELGHRLVAIHEEHEVDVLAYCLMGNHFHLLLRSPPGVLSVAMQHLSSVYTRRFNLHHGRDGPLFRSRFLSIPVETDPYLLWVTRYIHRNPLDLPGVDRLDGYRWSSYQVYLGLRPVPVFVDLEPVMGVLGGGVEALVRMTEDGRRDSASSGRGPFPGLDPRDVWSLAELAVANSDLRGEAPPEREVARRAIVRVLVVLVARRCSEPAVVEALLRSTGARSAQAQRSLASRAEARLRSDPAIARMLRWISAQIVDAPATVCR